MTEHHSALDTALDLFLFAPVGLALSAAEEIPKLAAKGRAQLNGQVSMARVVGQFAVNEGRRRIERRFAPGTGRPAPTHEPAPPSERAPDAVYDDMVATSMRSDVVVSDVEEHNGSVHSAAPSPSAEALAIPGYDSLSASQVVQRLAGLSSDELAAVGAYESAHRGRRTVLTRVNQLQAS